MFFCELYIHVPAIHNLESYHVIDISQIVEQPKEERMINSRVSSTYHNNTVYINYLFLRGVKRKLSINCSNK